MQAPPFLKVHSPTPDIQAAGWPSLTQRHPSSALAGVPVNSAAPISRPARMRILRMEGITLLEKTRHYATGTPKYQAKLGLASAARRVLNRIYCCGAVSGALAAAGLGRGFGRGVFGERMNRAGRG